MSIADAVVACAETFRRLCADLSASNIHDDEKRARYSGFIHEVSACHERFELWSSNLGAHRRDKNALDKRLREASTLQSRVVHYLKDLEGALADSKCLQSWYNGRSAKFGMQSLRSFLGKLRLGTNYQNLHQKSQILMMKRELIQKWTNW